MANTAEKATIAIIMTDANKIGLFRNSSFLRLELLDEAASAPGSLLSL
ncbi:MAG: hypothetical protein ABJL55_11305 [Roseibium sp.]